jgi:predicted DNA binding CopG/RHH family protein
MKQLNVRISEELLKEIKFIALKRNVNLQTWLTQVIIEEIAREKEND